MQPIRHHPLKQFAARLAFFPGLWFCRALALARIWQPWHRVAQHLIIGAFPSPRELRRLHALGVRLIINLCEEHPGNAAAIERLGLRQHRVPCLDFQVPSRPHIEHALALIRAEAAAGRTIYLHCKAGRLRSAIVAMAWLIHDCGLTPADAAQRLRSTRPQVDGRLLQRADWEQFAKNARGAAMNSPTAASAGQPHSPESSA